MDRSSRRLLAAIVAVAAMTTMAIVLGIAAPARVIRAIPLSAPSAGCSADSYTAFLPFILRNYPLPPQFEVTQGVQQPDNSVPLIAGRTSFVRLTITSTTAHANVSAWLLGARDGIPLPGSPIAALNNPRTLRPTADRGVLGDTFNFQLPLSWLNGTIALSADVTNSSTFTFETGAKAFQFVQSNPLPVTIVPIAYTCSSGGSGTTTPAPPYAYLTDMTYRMYPVPSVLTSTHATLPFAGPCISSGVPNPTSSDWSRLLSTVTDAWEADGYPDRYYYGLIKIYCGSSCISGMGWIGWPVATGFDGTNASHWGASETHAHEVTHNQGRQHAPGCGATGPDPSFPYVSGGKGYIGNSAHPNYGFDITTQAIYPYTQYYDITGYCNPSWVSDYTYEALLAGSQSQLTFGSATAQGNRVLLVSGQIDPSSGRVIFGPAYVLDMLRTVRLPDPGEYILELLDASGSVINSYPFEPAKAIADPFQGGTASEVTGFHLALPYADGIQSIRLRRGDLILGALVAGAHAPSLSSGAGTFSADSGALRVSWLAKDADGESLHYLVRASVDDGATWETIGVNLSSPSIDLYRDEWSGKRVIIKVSASDGLHTTSSRLGPFTVP